jgi:hypothetical protein
MPINFIVSQERVLLRCIYNIIDPSKSSAIGLISAPLLIYTVGFRRRTSGVQHHSVSSPKSRIRMGKRLNRSC